MQDTTCIVCIQICANSVLYVSVIPMSLCRVICCFSACPMVYPAGRLNAIEPLHRGSSTCQQTSDCALLNSMHDGMVSLIAHRIYWRRPFMGCLSYIAQNCLEQRS